MNSLFLDINLQERRDKMCQNSFNDSDSGSPPALGFACSGKNSFSIFDIANQGSSGRHL